MKKVMVFGTFDTLHKGHLFFLTRAAGLGDELTAVVARDRTVGELKGRTPYHNFNSRVAKLRKTGLVRDILPSDKDRGSWGVIQSVRPQIICLGHDQHLMEESLREWLTTQEDYSPEIVILPPFKRQKYSSTAERKRRGVMLYLLMILSMVLMASSWISGKYVSSEAPFPVLVFWRFCFSLLPFLPFTLKKDAFRFHGGSSAYTLLSALFLVLFNLLFFAGLSRGAAGKGGVIVTTLNPLITAALVLIPRGKKPEKALLTGLALGLIGGILLSEPEFLGGEGMKSGAVPYFLAAAFCWALLTVFSGKAQEHIGLRRYNLFLYLFASLLSLPLALPHHPFDFTRLTPGFWINIIYLALVVSSLATSLYFLGTRKLGAHRAGSFTLLIPFLALFLSWFFLGEIPRLFTLAGGTLSLGALYLINFRKKDNS
ncbi:MAG: EamA family transporter [Spirochaetales bacterium]|nr:EamA family transporter [Spirochaetales bacterium]